MGARWTGWTHTGTDVSEATPAAPRVHAATADASGRPVANYGSEGPLAAPTQGHCESGTPSARKRGPIHRHVTQCPGVMPSGQKSRAGGG